MIIAASTSVYHNWNKLIFSTEIDRYILSIVPTPGWAPRPPHRHLTVTDAHRRNLTNTGTSLRWPKGLQLFWVPQLAPKTRRGLLTLVMRLLKFTHTAAALCNRPVWLWPHHLFIFTLMWKRIRYLMRFRGVFLSCLAAETFSRGILSRRIFGYVGWWLSLRWWLSDCLNLSVGSYCPSRTDGQPIGIVGHRKTLSYLAISMT